MCESVSLLGVAMPPNHEPGLAAGEGLPPLSCVLAEIKDQIMAPTWLFLRPSGGRSGQGRARGAPAQGQKGHRRAKGWRTLFQRAALGPGMSALPGGAERRSLGDKQGRSGSLRLSVWR